MGVESIVGTYLFYDQQQRERKLQEQAIKKEERRAKLLNTPTPVAETAKLDTLSSRFNAAKTSVNDLFYQPNTDAGTGLATGSAVSKALGIGK